MTARRRREAGFTLIEALVAMAVLAVGAVSLLTATESHSRRIGDVTDRTAARWAADYRLTELRLGLTPASGPVESFGRTWTVAAETQPTEDPALARVTVRVGPARPGGVASGPGGRGDLAVLTGYLERQEDG